jgi:branched-chain amino acid transport system substrate-binding protein
MKKRFWSAAVFVAVVVVILVLVLVLKKDSSSAKNEITIASIIPLTGPGGEFGSYNLQASELFVEEYNKRHEGQIRLRHVFQDSKSLAKDGVNAAQTIFLTEHPFALQVQLSAVSMAVAPVAKEKKVVLFTIAGAGGPKDVYEFAFRNYPDPVLTARETASIFLKDNADARVAILRINDDFGLAVGAAFSDRLKQMDVPLVADEAFEKTGTDFRAEVTKILFGKPNVVYLVGFGNPVGRIIAQLRQLGFKGEILGGPEIAFADVLGAAKDAAEGVRYLDLAFDPTSTEEPTRSFVERYKARYGKLPSAVSAVVYDGWSLLLHAVERAGSTEPSQIAGELTKVSSFSGVCGTLSSDSGRDVVYPLVPRIIRQGRPVVVKE